MKLLSSLEDTSALFTGPAKISALGALGESYVSDVRNMLFSLKPSDIPNISTQIHFLKNNVPFFRLMRLILGDFSQQVPSSLHPLRNLEIPKFVRCTAPFRFQLLPIKTMITSLWKVAEKLPKSDTSSNGFELTIDLILLAILFNIKIDVSCAQLLHWTNLSLSFRASTALIAPQRFETW